MSLETLTVEVKPYMAPRSMTWFVTWEGVPEGWAIAVLNDMFYFPVRRTETWPNGTNPTIPGPVIDRKVDITFTTNGKGRYVCYDTKTGALAYIYRHLGDEA